MREAKNDKELFYKTDTHWNLRGAFIGFTTILKALQARFPDSTFTTTFTFGPDITKPCDDNQGLCDLARMAMQEKDATITSQTLTDFKPCATAQNLALHGFSNLSQRQDMASFIRGCDKKQLMGIVFRDSFFVSIEPFLSENFKHITYPWKTYDQENIEQALKYQHIDVVVDEVVEGFHF